MLMKLLMTCSMTESEDEYYSEDAITSVACQKSIWSLQADARIRYKESSKQIECTDVSIPSWTGQQACSGR